MTNKRLGRIESCRVTKSGGKRLNRFRWAMESHDRARCLRMLCPAG